MKTWWGLCPACGGQFGCSCESCMERHPEQVPVVISHTIGEGSSALCLEQCPHCGFIEDLKWWEELSITIAFSKDRYEKILKENQKDN